MARLKFVNEEIINPIRFKDEPHFQYEILHEDIPITYKNTHYFPIVSEFPSSPGIDLIYYNEKAEIILAELKHLTNNYSLAQKETIHHYEKFKILKIQDIITYAANKNIETNKKRFEQFKNVFTGERNTKISDLFANNRLIFIALFYGYEPKNLKPTCSDVLFLIYNKEKIRVKNIEYTGDPISSEKVSEEYSTKYNNKNIARKYRGKKSILSEIKNSRYSLVNKLFNMANDNNFKIKLGTGKIISFSAQISDSHKKNRSILNVYNNRIEIPGNLYNQQRYLNIQPEIIDNYFSQILEISRNFNMHKTQAGTFRIFLEKFDETYIKQLFKILIDFKEIIKNNT